MKRTLIVAVAVATLVGCAAFRNHHRDNPYASRLFIEQFLDPNNPLDAQIQQTINDLRANPRSAALHNRLGQLLRQKGFPKDAEVEFERAVNSDPHLFSAWYNLGLIRQARGDYTGASFAYHRAIAYRKGFSEALFQLGLMEEQRHNTGAAVGYYAKAFTINRSLLDVRVNPRIVDSKLVDLALLRAYPNEHARVSTQFYPTPPGYTQPNLEPAPAQQAPPPKPPL
ncbi:MAG TPA: tetratricopeptide repeat protein [Thermoanaerobaculia bacterium]|nr:tetratricopeptide repeat protein [Thermoanaerobaculia bacterium]